MVQQFRSGMNRIHKAAQQCSLSIQDLPGEQQPSCYCYPNELGQSPIRTRTGKDSERQFRLSKARSRAAESKVARQGQLTTSTEGGAIDQGDRRPAERLEPLEKPSVNRSQRCVGITVNELTDVGARHENAWCRRMHDENGGIRTLRMAESIVQFLGHRFVESVPLIRTIKPQEHDAVPPVDSDQSHR